MIKYIIVGFLLVSLSLQSFKIGSKDKQPEMESDKLLIAEPAGSIEEGKAVYTRVCIACHQAEGQGIPNAFPPLAKSDYLNGNVSKAIKATANGLNGEITVNGKKYNGVMPNPNLTDKEVADVLTYVYSSWGNSKKVVTVAMVKAQK